MIRPSRSGAVADSTVIIWIWEKIGRKKHFMAASDQGQQRRENAIILVIIQSSEEASKTCWRRRGRFGCPHHSSDL